MLVFVEGGKPENSKKNPARRLRKFKSNIVIMKRRKSCQSLRTALDVVYSNRCQRHGLEAEKPLNIYKHYCASNLVQSTTAILF